MEPVGVDYRAAKGFVVIHRCQRCRLERRNKAAPDDTDALIELMRAAQASARADGEVPHEAVVSRASIEADVAAAARPLGLTARESEILAYVARGKTNREIGEMLWIAPTTVRRHLENIYAKLGVHTRTSAVTRALSGAPVTRGTA
jgi:DNA-binding CsgD family transcriptional regulator